MKRSILDYFILMLKGISMGAADVVPGVSGGTIAFISGIYEELLQTIDNLKLGLLKTLKKEGFKAAWQKGNLSFLATLFLGIFISILTFSKLIGWLLEHQPILLWSFFFGLILASIWFVGKQIVDWNVKIVLSLVVGTVLSYYITIAEPLGTSDSYVFLFFSGFLAIIAMILPGISGAFILVLLGAYQGVLNTVNQFRESLASGNVELLTQSATKLSVLALGAVVGLKVFSGFLNWMFTHHKNMTLALLTGFMMGSLNKIWPWKEVISWRVNSKNLKVPLMEKNISPMDFPGENHLLWAILLSLAGIVLILLFEKLAAKKPV
jgi:putative membrane protein